MKANLKIKNFGPIKDAEIEINQITVLIGEQAAGKSTIAKLIAIFNEPEFYYYSEDKIEFNFTEALIKYNIQNYIKKDTEIAFNSSSVNLKYSKGELLDLIVAGKLPTIQASIYIPTERFLISILNHSAIEFMNKSVTLPKSVTQFGTYFQKAKSELRSETKIDFLDISYSNKDGNDTIKNKSMELHLQESASGYQSVVPLFLVMKYYAEQIGEKTIIVEEPELNLYPKTQNRLMSVMSRFANENSNNLIITTHSPYILTSLNNLLFAGQIANENTEKEVTEIIPKESRINSENFSAYHIENGKSVSIFDEKSKLINETELDSASDIINENFDSLMNIYKTL